MDGIAAAHLMLEEKVTGLIDGAHQGMATLDASARADLNGAALRLEAVACKCPAGCSGTVNAPPGIATAPLLQPS